VAVMPIASLFPCAHVEVKTGNGGNTISIIDRRYVPTGVSVDFVLCGRFALCTGQRGLGELLLWVEAERRPWTPGVNSQPQKLSFTIQKNHKPARSWFFRIFHLRLALARCHANSVICHEVPLRWDLRIRSDNANGSQI